LRLPFEQGGITVGDEIGLVLGAGQELLRQALEALARVDGALPGGQLGGLGCTMEQIIIKAIQELAGVGAVESRGQAGIEELAALQRFHTGLVPCTSNAASTARRILGGLQDWQIEHSDSLSHSPRGEGAWK